MELICLTCGAESQGFNVKVSRSGYPHKENCKVQNVRPRVAGAKTVTTTATVAKEILQELEPTETPLPEPTEEKPKKKRKAPKRTEDTN